MHDLCLALGGMTVTELRSRMSYTELRDWQTYCEEMGPPNQSIRVEWAIARAVALFLKNVSPNDLMAWPKEVAKPATAEDIFSFMTQRARETKTHVHT